MKDLLGLARKIERPGQIVSLVVIGIIILNVIALVTNNMAAFESLRTITLLIFLIVVQVLVWNVMDNKR